MSITSPVELTVVDPSDQPLFTVAPEESHYIYLYIIYIYQRNDQQAAVKHMLDCYGLNHDPVLTRPRRRNSVGLCHKSKNVTDVETFIPGST